VDQFGEDGGDLFPMDGEGENVVDVLWVDDEWESSAVD
jgi:hypothetical protein